MAAKGIQVLDDFATAFRRWFERAEKCVRIGGNFVEKS
jgi:hypothetical protein